MKSASNDSSIIRTSELAQTNPSSSYLNTFTTTLSNGREVTLREMTGKDLLYVEEELQDLGEYKRAFHLTERLNVGNKITFDEITELKLADIEKLAELVGKASGQEIENPK